MTLIYKHALSQASLHMLPAYDLVGWSQDIQIDAQDVLMKVSWAQMGCSNEAACCCRWGA